VLGLKTEENSQVRRKIETCSTTLKALQKESIQVQSLEKEAVEDVNNCNSKVTTIIQDIDSRNLKIKETTEKIEHNSRPNILKKITSIFGTKYLTATELGKLKSDLVTMKAVLEDKQKVLRALEDFSTKRNIESVDHKNKQNQLQKAASFQKTEMETKQQQIRNNLRLMHKHQRKIDFFERMKIRILNLNYLQVTFILLLLIFSVHCCYSENKTSA
jgi:hypothetical protein